MAIAPGVVGFATRTPTLPPATHTNSYALGERELLLVEPASPYPEEQRAFVEWARGLESQGRELKAIFLTHHHIDHVGGALALSRELQLPLLAHPATAAHLAAAWPADGRQLDDGETLLLDGAVPQRWQVLHTPGHAPGHLCLYEAALGQLVVGDMVASVGTILIEPGDGHMATYLEQLKRLSALGASLALPAHGDPIRAVETAPGLSAAATLGPAHATPTAGVDQRQASGSSASPSDWFDFYISHRLRREAKVLDAVKRLREADLDQLVSLAYDDTPPSVWGLAKLSLHAHLIKLVEEGRVCSSERGYRPGVATLAEDA